MSVPRLALKVLLYRSYILNFLRMIYDSAHQSIIVKYFASPISLQTVRQKFLETSPILFSNSKDLECVFRLPLNCNSLALGVFTLKQSDNDPRASCSGSTYKECRRGSVEKPFGVRLAPRPVLLDKAKH